LEFRFVQFPIPASLPSLPHAIFLLLIACADAPVNRAQQVQNRWCAAGAHGCKPARIPAGLLVWE
jgi:hypothetical protein